MDGRLLLNPGLTSGFGERLSVDHKDDVRSVTPSSTNDYRPGKNQNLSVPSHLFNEGRRYFAGGNDASDNEQP